MKITISRTDNAVIVDGVGFKVDCRDLHALISVVQWSGDSPKEGPDWFKSGSGHLEFFNDHRGVHMTNLPIASFADYTFLYEKWQAKKAEADEMAAADVQTRSDGALAHAALPTTKT